MILSRREIEEKLIVFTVIATIFCDFISKLSSSGYFRLPAATYIYAALQYISIIIFFRSKILIRGTKIPNTLNVIYNLWMLYLIVSIVRGAIVGSTYWEYKFLFLGSTLFTLVSIVYYLGQNLYFTSLVFNFMIKKVFLYGFLLVPISLVTSKEIYGRIMIPIGVFLLFTPYVSSKWKKLLLLVSLVSLFVDVGFRTNIVKMIISYGILSLYFFDKIINGKILKIIWLTFFITPITLFILALAFNFNVFKEFSDSSDDLTTVSSNGEEQKLNADTRTGLYEEVLEDVYNSGQIIFGKSPSKGHKTTILDIGAVKGYRFQSEVNILNVFLYFGIVGVILFTMLLMMVSYKAINKSNNKVSKMLGLLIASRFMLSFLEEFTKFDLNFYFFWLVLGLISTSKFRSMTDNDVKIWLAHGFRVHRFKELINQVDKNHK